MQLILRLILVLALLPGLLPAARAQTVLGPAGLYLGVGAVESGAVLSDPSSMEFPRAGFDGAAVPMLQAEGRLEQRAFRLDGSRQTTLALLQPLAAQLGASGWEVVFTCEAGTCGGFDFRYAMQVLPEPQMHVDLGDFRYLLAQDGEGGVISLLVSRSQDRGFVQVTSVTPSTTAEVVAPAPAAPAAAAPPPDAAPQAQGGLAEALAAKGTAALEDLVFASGKAALEAGEYPSLAELAAWLVANPSVTVTLVGHTDATGTLQGNIALSRARAEAVRDRLVAALGADGGRIAAEGAGYLAPRASNQTPEGRQANRRVEVVVTSVTGP